MDSRRRDLSAAEKMLALTDAQRASFGTHAGLWLDKYIEQQERKDDEQARQRTKQSEQSKQGEQNPRVKHVRQVTSIPIHNLYGPYFQAWEDVLRGSGAALYQATATGRMIVGLGGESVLETSVELHHTYGVPYIPGSALKGLAASYIHWKSDEKSGANWKKGGKFYNIVFGDADAAGFITFFDALPIPDTMPNKEQERQKQQDQDGQKLLHPDIITVHHQKYYQDREGKKAPADWDNPNPVPFLSATGSYLIALAAPDLPENQRQKWLHTTFTILQRALKDVGIGAKTSSGYGRMELVPYAGRVQAQKIRNPAVRKILDDIAALPATQVNQGIQAFYKQWKEAHLDEDARKLVAQAIIEKIRQNGYEQKKLKTPWYPELLDAVEGVRN